MAKRSKRRHLAGRTTPKGTRPAGVRDRAPIDDVEPVPDLVAGLRPLLRASTPFDLLVQASGFVEILTERPNKPLGPERVQRTDGPEFVNSLVDSGWPEPLMLAKAMAVMLPDRPLRQHIRSRPLPSGAPRWAATMDAIEITGTFAQEDPLGDGDNHWVNVRWPDGSEATAIMFVDHNMGSILKDAFLIPTSAEQVLEMMHEVSDDVVALTSIDPAELRARVEWSAERWDELESPVDTETWPGCRPLVEWILGHLPEGGRGWEFPQWTPTERSELVEDFMSSPFTADRAIAATSVEAIVELLVTHGCDAGSGDPLRWSPVVVEVVLSDWLPRHVGALSDLEIEAVPRVLEQFVTYAHRRRGVDEQATLDTLSAIVVWEDDFFGATTQEGDPLRRAVLGDQTSEDYLDRLTDALEQRVIDLVGGRTAYDTLDDAPLGDVDFDWAVVPADMTDLTAETLALVDRWSIEHFDAEVRSIARVALAAVVATDRSVFKRSKRTDVLAAAILGFLIHRLTERFNRAEREAFGWTATSVSPFAELVGLTPATVGARVQTITNVLDRADVDWPRYLHSSQRRTALESKRSIAEYRTSIADRT